MALSAGWGPTHTAPWTKSTSFWIWEQRECRDNNKIRLGASFIKPSFQKSFQNTYFSPMDPNFLLTPIAYLKGVGPHRAETLKSELGIETYRDMLQLFPHRYLDRTSYYKIVELRPSGAEVQVIGKIAHLRMVEQKRGKRLVATFVDETGQMELVWFRAHKWFAENLKIDQPYVAFGRVTRFANGYSMARPELEPVKDPQQGPKIGMQPVYPSTEKLTAKGITNRAIAKMIQQILVESKGNFPESLSPRTLGELRLMPKAQAMLNIHFPKDQDLLAKARFRLKFEELFYVQLQLIAKKMLRKQRIKGMPFERVGPQFTDFFENHLPFDLTRAQKKVIKEIRNDLGSRAQMNRLL